MPIGKNALKRVTNNGYSKVSVSAPDMENSTVEAVAEEKKKAAPKSEKNPAPKAPVAKAEKNPAPKAPVAKAEKKPAPKAPVAKAEKKPAPKKKPATPKAPIEKKPQKAEEKITRPDGFIRFGLGADLPVHLL